MGRPLNKKFFGNFNIGTGGYTPAVGGNTGGDDGIGGEGLASINWSNYGNYINRLPTFASLAAPSIPGGVQAAGVLHSRAINASPAVAGTGYRVGDVLTDANGSTWTVTGLKVVSFTVTNPAAGGNTAYDTGNVVALDNSNSNGGNSTNWTSPFVIKPIAISGSKLTGGTIDQAGVWVGGGTPPATFTLTADNTRGTTLPGAGYGLPNYGGTGDCNAAGAIISVVWGIATASIGTSIDYAYGTTYLYDSSNTVTGGNGTSGALNVGFAADHIAVTEKGSGYRGTEAVTFTTVSGGGEVRATGTIVLTTDSGSRVPGANYNVATNQDNAIIIHANTTGAGTKVGDIQKQVGSRRYKVRTADGIARVNLVASGSPAIGYAYIVATDSTNHTYYVTKLTAHRATLVPFGSAGHEFPLVADGIGGYEPVSAGWVLSGAVLNKTVVIENA